MGNQGILPSAFVISKLRLVELCRSQKKCGEKKKGENNFKKLLNMNADNAIHFMNLGNTSVQSNVVLNH